MRRTKIWAMLVLVVISFSAVSFGIGISSQSEDDDTVFILHKQGTDLDMIDEPGYEILADYEDFVLIRSTVENKDVLQHSGSIIETLDNRGHVGLISHAFDTSEGEPEISDDLTIGGYSSDEDGFYIVQFIGPIKPEWQDELNDMGVTLHEFRNRFNFIVETTPEILRKVETLDFVNWVGVYQPAYKFDHALLEERGDLELEIHMFADGRSLQTVDKIARLGGDILYYSEERVTTMVSADSLSDIARIPNVNAIELGGFDLEFYNSHATWITQTNSYGNRKVTDMGVTGLGELVCVMDSELYMTGGGHEMWRDTDGNPVGDNHRKVQANYVPTGSSASLGSGVYHGTHVAGTVLGDAPPYDSYNNQDGNAMSARLIFQDIGTAAGGLSVPSDMYNNAYGRSYNEGARAHTNSWGGGWGYGTSARTSDLFTWNYKDYNILYAMANDGPGSNTLSSQSEGKNVISVGAAVNYNSHNNMASFSSRGYADDGRIKPTVVHIGQGVNSASRSASGYSGMSGTSMSTPGMAGQVGQVRHYYEGGWYPSGSSSSADGFNPSAALVRATIINGAVEMTGSGAYTNDNRFPNGDQGYGRSLLDRAMYFQGDSRRSIAFDSWNEGVALSTGQSWSMEFQVDDPSQDVEVSLAWSDYRGPSGASPSNPAIVNDLDLELTAPDGTRYTGNAYTGSNPGYSQPNPSSNPWNGLRTGEHDGLNVEENILLLPDQNGVSSGTYELTVSAHQVTEGTQPFAVVVTGGVTEESGDPPEVSVTRPSGGETFDAGTQETITWSTTPGDNPVDHINLEYSVDAGSNWQTIDTNVADTGSYTWTVPNEHSSDCLVRVEAVDTAGRRGDDESTSTFTIVGTPPAPPDNLEVQHTGGDTAVLFQDDVSTDKGYTTDVSGSASGSEWAIRQHGSSVGSNSWDFGDGQYHKSSGAGYISMLTSPAIEIPAEATEVELSFDHWRDLGFVTTMVDGGNLKLSTNGVNGNFDLITPNEGYDGEINENFGNPLGGEPAWGSSVDWEAVTFDLSAYAGDTIHLRWEAGIEDYDEDFGAGWRIDNVLVTAEGIPSEGDDHNLISWDASPDELTGDVSHYNIYRSENENTGYEQVGQVDADTDENGVRVFDDFQDGNHDGWTVYDGDWSIDQSGGNYWLEGQGQISTPFDQAYGRWEWDFQMVRTDEVGGSYQLMRFYFIQDQPEPDGTSCSGYYIIVTGDVGGDGQINLWRLDDGEPSDSTLISGSWTPNTDWNTLAIERDENGFFVMYLNGDILGDTTDNTYTSSTHIGFRNEGPEATDRHRISEVRVSQGADEEEGYEYLDLLKGAADDTLWWYMVRAVGTNGLEEQNENAVQEPGVDIPTMDIPLTSGGAAEGWNFVSFNLVPQSTSLADILEDPEHGISGEYDSVMYYDSSADRWYSYVPDRPEHFNNLETWDHTMGVWIRATSNAVLTVAGSRPDSTTISLQPGWNMIGLPSETTGNHGLPAEVTSVGYFDGSSEYNIVYTDSVSNFQFSPGEAYWIYNGADDPVQWQVSY